MGGDRTALRVGKSTHWGQRGGCSRALYEEREQKTPRITPGLQFTQSSLLPQCPRLL